MGEMEQTAKSSLTRGLPVVQIIIITVLMLQPPGNPSQYVRKEKR
jgi:hypothetical protein